MNEDTPKGFQHVTKKTPSRETSDQNGNNRLPTCHMEGSTHKFRRRSFGKTEIDGEAWLLGNLKEEVKGVAQ
jgi:hypothetical protein